jgi:hypothetical protein
LKLGNSFVGNYARSQPVIRDPDWLDRMTIRQRLLNTFGYAFGSALAQHFGLQSEHLDVTTDLNVAAFFATHVGPRYETVGLRDQLEDGGVIFRVPRLPLPQGDVLNDWDYFGAPGTMVYADVVHPFEQHVSIADSLDSLRVYYELRRTTGERNSRLLKLPHDCLTDSRMGRQAAAAVIPDEIHVATRGIFVPHPIFGSVRLADATPLTLQSIEDLRTREGVRIYYFRHSPSAAPQRPRAADLWPNETDFVLMLVVLLISSSFDGYAQAVEPVPPRYDLIDPGFGAIDAERLLHPSAQGAADESEDERTLRYAELVSGPADRLNYLIRKAAALFSLAHTTGDAAVLRASLKVGERASVSDPESVVLHVLQSLGYAELGEHKHAQAAIGRALASARNVDDIEVVRKIQVDLSSRRFDSDFAEVFNEYYQTF